MRQVTVVNVFILDDHVMSRIARNLEEMQSSFSVPKSPQHHNQFIILVAWASAHICAVSFIFQLGICHNTCNLQFCALLDAKNSNNELQLHQFQPRFRIVCAHEQQFKASPI
jgi:hypothetical protein